MTADVETVARGLTKAQQAEFLTFDSAEWKRRAFRADRRGGRCRNFQRVQKCKAIGLIEHRIDGGALYRLTPLGLAVRQYLMEQPK